LTKRLANGRTKINRAAVDVLATINKRPRTTCIRSRDSPLLKPRITQNAVAGSAGISAAWTFFRARIAEKCFGRLIAPAKEVHPTAVAVKKNQARLPGWA
jgi:hypothetical protein